MDQEKPERPVGVTAAAVLITFIGIAGLMARVRAADMSFASAIWLTAHISALVIAVGLWKLKNWAHWLFIVFVLGSIAITLTRLVSQESSHGSAYHLGRLGIMAAWLVYFFRWQVRGAFAPPGFGR
jgi:uncharacterized membrane protein (DUF2068 family)